MTTHNIAFTWGDAVQAFGEVMKVGCEVLDGKVGRNGVDEEVDPGAEDLVAPLLRQAAAIISILAVVVSITRASGFASPTLQARTARRETETRDLNILSLEGSSGIF